MFNRPPIKIIFILAAIAIVFFLFSAFDISSKIEEFLDWISTLGALAPVVFIVCYAFACVLFIPGSLLTLGAGFLFGVVKGSVVVSIASTLGATLAFLVGRYFVRGWVAEQVETKPKFRAIDEAVNREGWKIVGLTRLSPIFPFNLLNYGYGITGVSLRDYFFASWIGMMPGTVMYVYLGSLAGDFATLSTGSGEKTTGEWILYGVGLMATIVVTVYVTRIAKRALAKRMK